jgi:hypothetical protein
MVDGFPNNQKHFRRTEIMHEFGLECAAAAGFFLDVLLKLQLVPFVLHICTAPKADAHD